MCVCVGILKRAYIEYTCLGFPMSNPIICQERFDFPKQSNNLSPIHNEGSIPNPNFLITPIGEAPRPLYYTHDLWIPS